MRNRKKGKSELRRKTEKEKLNRNKNGAREKEGGKCAR